MLGAVQGLTEVHPVSSSAQLTLLPWLLGWPAPGDRTAFAAGLHAGSTAGVALALRTDLRALDRAGWSRLALSAAPAALAGALGHGVVERRLGRPGPTAALLGLSGLALLVADSLGPSAVAVPAAVPSAPPSHDHGNLSRPLGGPALPRSWGEGAEGARGKVPGLSGADPGDLVAASLAQVAALVPGVSRAGATLTALRARGVDRPDAARLSLLMSLPVTGGAALLTAVRARQAPPVLPTAVAGVTAYAAARRLRPTRRWVTASVLYRLAVVAAVGARLRREGG